MALDITMVMRLLQRKCSSVRELSRLTKELEETFARNDEVSASLLLQMRQEELGKIDECMEQIWEMGKDDQAVSEKLRWLVQTDPSEAVGESFEEKKIFEIRRKTQVLLNELKMSDQRLNKRLSARRSDYKAEVV